MNPGRTPVARPAEGPPRREFRLFWTAGAVDGLGSCISVLVLPLVLLESGHSSGMAGLLATVALVSGLVTAPIAGVFADRRPRRAMMTASALVAAAAMGTVFAAVALDRVTFAHLLAAALVEQTAGSAYAAAAQGTIRGIVSPDRYAHAVSRLQARDQAVQIAGPSLGGVLYQFARWVPFLADALSYLLTAVLVRSMRDTPAPTREKPAGSFRADLAEGVRFVRTDDFLRFVMVWTAGLNAVLGTLYYHAVFSSYDRGASASSIGLILTLCGVGGLAGALAAPWVVRRAAAPRVVVAASWLMVPVAAGLALADRTWSYGLLLGAVSLTAPAVVIVLHARAVLVVPDALQARAGTVLGTAGEGTAALAPVAAGVLVGAYGGGAVAIGCAGALAALAAYATRRASLLRTPATAPELAGSPS